MTVTADAPKDVALLSQRHLRAFFVFRDAIASFTGVPQRQRSMSPARPGCSSAQSDGPCDDGLSPASTTQRAKRAIDAALATNISFRIVRIAAPPVLAVAPCSNSSFNISPGRQHCREVFGFAACHDHIYSKFLSCDGTRPNRFDANQLIRRHHRPIMTRSHGLRVGGRPVSRLSNVWRDTGSVQLQSPQRCAWWRRVP